MKLSVMLAKKYWMYLILFYGLFQFSCSNPKHLDKTPLLILENIELKSEITSRSISWEPPSNESINAAHSNHRRIGNEYYIVFINSTLDSVVICNYSTQTVTRFKLPVYSGYMVDLLYFHNSDSIFLFYDREIVFTNLKNGNKYCDFLLCNSKGEVKNEYSLENVPHIYKGQKDPLVLISPAYIDNNLILQSKLYIPFEIYLPKLENKAHKRLKISMVCEYNLRDKSLRMLNITLPKDLIGKKFKSESADGKIVMFFLVNDSILEYHFYNSGSIYLYNLNTDKSTEVFSADRFPFRNNEVGEPAPPEFYSFQGFKYSPRENMYLRHISAAESDQFQWFLIVQLFDEHFNLIGCHVAGTNRLCQLNDTNYSPFFFDDDGFLSVSPTNHTGVYYHVSHGIPTSRSSEYIKQHYLIKKIEAQTTPADKDISYNDRLLQYFTEMKIPEGSKVIVVGFDKACVHCLEYLFGSWQRNEKAFRAQNIHYLFIGSDATFVDQLISGYEIPPEFVWVDEDQVYKKYLLPEERHLNPLVHYKSSTEAEVIIYDFKTLDADFRKFLNLK